MFVLPKGNSEHGLHGWFVGREPNYSRLLKSDAVKVYRDSYPPSSRRNQLYALNGFLRDAGYGPEEFLQLSDQDIKRTVKIVVLKATNSSRYAWARRLYYAVMRFLEMNGRSVTFTRSEKRALFRRVPKRIIKQYIPGREDIYRAVDAYPANGGNIAWLRGKAVILCLWQSGVRAGCLCTWTYGMFKEQLWPRVRVPVRIKVVAYRPKGVYDVAMDKKISSYGVNYYFTFLSKEAAEALKQYLEARMKAGWKPKDSDPVFVIHGPWKSQWGQPLTTKHVNAIVKNAFKQIGVQADRVWSHCLRKAFRKTLYESGINGDVGEALMGHMLVGSRSSYFDYHSVEFAEQQYSLGFWERIKVDRIRKLEKEVAKMRQLETELKQTREELKALKSMTKAPLELEEIKKLVESHKKIMEQLRRHGLTIEE